LYHPVQSCIVIYYHNMNVFLKNGWLRKKWNFEDQWIDAIIVMICHWSAGNTCWKIRHILPVELPKLTAKKGSNGCKYCPPGEAIFCRHLPMNKQRGFLHFTAFVPSSIYLVLCVTAILRAKLFAPFFTACRTVLQRGARLGKAYFADVLA